MGNGKIHFKGLNGLRAMAALAVVISHTGINLPVFGFNSTGGSALAAYSVTVFFSLSGFLITFLLLKEKEVTGTVSIRQFYMRRILRIWPLYFLYLFIALALIWYFTPGYIRGELFWYFVLGANVPFILGIEFPLIAHYWSLAVEEQFYLFWPWLMRNKRKAKWLIAAVIAFLLLGKVAARIYHAKTGNLTPYTIFQVNRFDCMAIGAFGAILFEEKNKLFLKLAYSIPAQLIAWGSILLVGLNKFHVASLFDDVLIAAVTVVLIVNVSTNGRNIVRTDFRLLDQLGRISFGIYVYHPVCIFVMGRLAGKAFKELHPLLGQGLIYASVIAFTVLVSYISYYWFESYFLNIKKRLARVQSEA